MEIGELRLIPNETKVWSIALQEEIQFVHETIVEITNIPYGDKKYCFGKLKLVLFKETGIPGIMDKSNGDVTFLYNETTPYEIVWN